MSDLRPSHTMASRGATTIWKLSAAHLDDAVSTYFADFIRPGEPSYCYVNPGFTACAKQLLASLDANKLVESWCSIESIYHHHGRDIESGRKLGPCDLSGTLDLLIAVADLIGSRKKKHDVIGDVKLNNRFHAAASLRLCEICHLPAEASFHWGIRWQHREAKLRNEFSVLDDAIPRKKYPSLRFCPLHKPSPSNAIYRRDVYPPLLRSGAYQLALYLDRKGRVTLYNDTELKKFAYGLLRIGFKSDWHTIFDNWCMGSTLKMTMYDTGKSKKQIKLILELILGASRRSVFEVVEASLPGCAELEQQAAVMLQE